MYGFFNVIHIIACVFLVIAVLMQTSKGGGFQGIFGGGGEVIFSSPSGSSFLRKITVGLAITLGLSSLILTVLTRQRLYRSVLQTQPIAAPAAPGERGTLGAGGADPAAAGDSATSGAVGAESAAPSGESQTSAPNAPRGVSEQQNPPNAVNQPAPNSSPK